MTKTKISIIGVVALGTMALLVAQQRAQSNFELDRLRQDNEALRKELGEMRKLAAQRVRTEAEDYELARLRQGESELLRLRGEVGLLRSQLAKPEAERMPRPYALQQAGPEAERISNLADLPSLGEFFRLLTNSPDGSAQAATPESLASAMVETNPAAALALAEQLGPEDRRKFLDSAFAAWAKKDTEAALQWAEQHLSDPAQKDAAINAIRSVAPVGIGAELTGQDGHAVINRLFPGSAAELSGQIHPGDRILAVAQGDNAFVDARSLSLSDLAQSIRGNVGTVVQLQILPAGAPPDSLPITVAVPRDQIRYKR